MPPEYAIPERPATSSRVPADLDSARTKLVYLYLQTAGPATVFEMAEALGERALSLYPTIDRLADRSHVERRGETVVLHRERDSPPQR